MRRRQRCVAQGWLVAIAALSAACRAYDRDTYSALLDAANDSTVVADVADVSEPLDITDATDGAQGSDTGHTDDVTPDAALDPTSCDDINAGAIFCDGFENSALAGWSLLRQDGTAVRSVERVYRGTAALRAEATASSGYAYLFHHALGGLTSGELFVRGFYYFPSGVPLARLTFVTAGESVSPYRSTQMRVLNEQVSGYDGAALRDVNSGPGAIVPRDQWVCIEYRVLIDDAAGAVDMWINDESIGGLSSLDTLAATGYAQLSVGIIGTSATQSPVVVYVDEVVASRTRVGCDR